MGKKKRNFGKMTVYFWSVSLFIAVGYVPTLLMKNPVVSMSAAAVAIIPFAGRAKSYLRAAGRGLVLGSISGLAIFSALTSLAKKMRLSPDDVRRLGWIYFAATVGMCVVVAVLSAHLSARRRRQIEQEWRG